MGTLEDFICNESENMRAGGVYTKRNIVERLLCEFAKKLDKIINGAEGHMVITVNLNADGKFTSNYTYDEIISAYNAGCKCSCVASILREDGTTPCSCAVNITFVGTNYIEWVALGQCMKLFEDGTYDLSVVSG